MPVLIKGMEMPFTCLTCDFHKCAGGVGDFCSLTKRRQFRFKNRPKDCPLVEIQPHGRLIDADALVNKLEISAESGNNGAALLMAAFFEVLKAAPTIIPAEEEP